MGKFSTIFMFVIALLGACHLAAGAVTRQMVLPLRILEGEPGDDSRIFGVDVDCNGTPSNFEIGCCGQSRISESLARQCAVTIEPLMGDNIERDPEGKPVMAGAAHIRLRFAGIEQELPVGVMHDAYCQKPEREGMLGFDIFQQFQWEVDPVKATLTLRPLGTPPKTRPLALLPLRLDKEAFLVHARIRNRTEEMALLPASSFIQVGPTLQHVLDFNSGKAIKPEVNRFGDVRTVWMHGDDVIELAPGIVADTDIRVAIMPGRTVVNSGLGQCLLNRFIYCVEPKRGQLRIMARVAGPTTRPAQR